MKRPKIPYRRPRIQKKIIRINFLSSRSRFFNSVNPFDNFVELACTSQGCGCFLADTKITLANGKTKKISDIRSNDQVLSYDTNNKLCVTNKVQRLLIHNDVSDSYILINDGLKVTKNHRLWVNNSSWKRVDELRIGDILLSINNKIIKVESMKLIKQNSIIYNLHLIHEPHNFFAKGILAHNGDVPNEKGL